MTSQVKGLFLVSLLKISVVGSNVPSSLKPQKLRLSASDTTLAKSTHREQPACCNF